MRYQLMKNIQIQIQKLDNQLDVDELASLTIKMWKFTRPDQNPTVERFGNWIKNLKYDTPPIIMKVYREETLVGWVLLFIHDSKWLEINPWALGGHPHILIEDPDKAIIAQLLVRECITYAIENAFTRVELAYMKKDTTEQYPFDVSLYTKWNLEKDDEIVFMSCEIAENEYLQVEFPEGVDVAPLKDTKYEDLYRCSYESFKHSGDRNFHSKTDEERREYFNGLFDKNEDLIEKASIVLVKGQKHIGFTLVRPTHGEGNGHLQVICVISDFRRTGLGSKLLNYAINTLKKLGYKTMSLGVDCENNNAIKLYEKFNFVKGWERVTYVWKRK